MPRATWSLELEELERQCDPDRRFVDVGFRLQVWRCACGKPHLPPSSNLAAVRKHLVNLRGDEHYPVAHRILSTVYGGRYDRLLQKYVGKCDPKNVRLVTCHEGQLPLLTFSEPGVIRVYAVGTPGSGKSFCAERVGLLYACRRAHSIGALIAPTGNGRRRLWAEFLSLARSLGFVESVSESKKSIVLHNGSEVLVLAAKASSRQTGSPLQGYSLDWVVPDESQNIDEEAHDEITARGRNAGRAFFILETATNSNVPAARLRRETLKRNPQCRVIHFHGFNNPWVPPAWWETLLAEYTERKYREFILAEDVPPELLLYPRFSYAWNVRSKPNVHGPGSAGWKDITAETVLAKYPFAPPGVQYVIGQDFGVLTNASIVCKIYRAPNGDRCWWAVDEIVSRYTPADVHARLILSRYSMDEVAIIADPHFNTKDEDRSDYNLMRRQGLWLKAALDDPGLLKREHRIAVLNGLLCDRDAAELRPPDTGRRRFFIHCDENGNASCPLLAQSLMSLQRNELGQAERDKKNANDMTHYPCAAGYLVWPWEKIPFAANPRPGAPGGTPGGPTRGPRIPPSMRRR